MHKNAPVNSAIFYEKIFFNLLTNDEKYCIIVELDMR
jgi:hypothetical protein